MFANRVLRQSEPKFIEFLDSGGPYSEFIDKVIVQIYRGPRQSDSPNL